jgi:hypothetical protein
MNDDLQDCIATAKKARDALLEGKMSVKEANAVTGANHTIISAYALDLRERMFFAEQQGRRIAGIGERIEETTFGPQAGSPNSHPQAQKTSLYA